MCKYGVGPKFDYGDPKAEPKILCTKSKLVTVELDCHQAYRIGPMLILKFKCIVDLHWEKKKGEKKRIVSEPYFDCYM